MVVLVVAGVLLSWGHSYANNQVASQLSAQKIVFPATSSPEFKILPAANRAQMGKYAGQPMTTGAQAEVYANYFIGAPVPDRRRQDLLPAVRRSAGPAEEPRPARPGRDHIKGTTLRSMLLEAYGFWQLGQIALIAAIASFIAAGLMLALSILGYLHLRRTAPEAEILPAIATRVPASAS